MSITDRDDLLDDFEVDFDTNIKGNKSTKEIIKSKSNKIIEDNSTTYVLYLVTDKYNPGLLDYFRIYGIKVSKIFNNLKEARDTILMQVEPTRIVVIETGTGRFTGVSARKDLVDLMGICDEDTKITIFYTDTLIKSEISIADEVDDKMIDWYTYRSTADVLARLLQAKENYKFDMEDEEVISINKESLNIKGLKVKYEPIDIGIPAISVEDIRVNMMENDSTEGLIEGYQIRV